MTGAYSVFFQSSIVSVSIFLGCVVTLPLAALPAAAAALVAAAAASATFSAAPGTDAAPKLPRKFWNLALYCSKGLSAADASSGSASRAVVEKRMVGGV